MATIVKTTRRSARAANGSTSMLTTALPRAIGPSLSMDSIPSRFRYRVI
jgi:hypothetical protein